MKREKELKTVNFMIKLYCNKKHKHKNGLCEECQGLQKYVELRLLKCPYGDDKPFCRNCKIHCYKPEMRDKIAKVMRFSGPRMIFYNPLLVVKHLLAGIKLLHPSGN